MEFQRRTVDTASLPQDTCVCDKAVKIKDGGHECQVCHKDAYDKLYVFAHMPEGIERLMKDFPAQNPLDIDAAIDESQRREDAELEEQHEHTQLKIADLLEDQVTIEKQLAEKKKAKKTKKAVNPLMEAVNFIKLVQKTKGDATQTHCILKYGMITAFDRVVAAGQTIPQHDLMAVAQTDLLHIALDRCGDNFSIVQQEGKLLVTSSEFSAYVPLIADDSVVPAVPDAAVAPLDDSFRDALKAVGVLVKDNAPRLMLAAIQLNPQSVLATNGQVIIEGWHGYDMPPIGMLVPKRFSEVLYKIKRKIVSFGYSKETFTVHFEDGSWLRTQLYQEKIGFDVVGKINQPADHKRPVPQYFFQAAGDVAKWSENGLVYCFDGRMSSHPPEKQMTSACRTYQMDGFAENRIYSIESLDYISKYALSFDHDSIKDITLFFGDKVRGAVMHHLIEKEAVKQLKYDSQSCGAYTGICEGICDGTCLDKYAKYKQMLADEDIPF